ncbi:MAG: YggT family protein [bacterium]
MMILGKFYWFLSWALITATAVIIGLIVLRLIANQADLNPFAWSSINIRRLTDPIISPVRRTLARMAVDSKYAPLVAILAAVLLGWFALQLVSALANTVAGIMVSLRAQAIIATMGYLLYGLLSLYSLMIFVRIILSWVTMSYRNRFIRFLVTATEPLLGPLRRHVPPVGAFDISPIVAFVIIWLLQAAVAGTLLRGRQIIFFA